MKTQNETDFIDAKLDEWLAGTPLEPSADFAERVLKNLKIDERVDAFLAQEAVVPAKNFPEKIVPAVRRDNAISFPKIAKIVAGFSSLAAAIVIGIFAGTRPNLAEQVNEIICEDATLSALAADENSLTETDFEIAGTISELLENLDEETLNLLAYNE